MILYGASFCIFLFVSFSLFFRANLPVWLKIAGTMLVFAISMKYVIYQIIGGAFFSPTLPRWFILCMEALYGALLLLFFLLLLWDVYLLLNWLLAKMGMPMPRSLPCGWIKLGLALAALAMGCWGTWETIRVPDVKTISLADSRWPCSLNGFKVVQLSDLHIGPILKMDWLQKVVQKVNEQKPDLVIMTGDYIDGYAADIARELEPLADLQARYGVFASSGNHEYYWNITEWEEAIKSLGVTWLSNSHKVLETGELPLVVAGVPDLNAERFGFEGPNLDKAFKDAPEGLRLLLSHQPRKAVEYLDKADMQFSGHTHGGIMFFLQPLIARFNGGFVNGLYELSQGRLYVSPGTGLWNGFSCRIGVPAEITSFIFSCREESENRQLDNN